MRPPLFSVCGLELLGPSEARLCDSVLFEHGRHLLELFRSVIVGDESSGGAPTSDAILNLWTQRKLIGYHHLSHGTIVFQAVPSYAAQKFAQEILADQYEEMESSTSEKCDAIGDEMQFWQYLRLLMRICKVATAPASKLGRKISMSERLSQMLSLAGVLKNEDFVFQFRKKSNGKGEVFDQVAPSATLKRMRHTPELLTDACHAGDGWIGPSGTGKVRVFPPIPRAQTTISGYRSNRPPSAQILRICESPIPTQSSWKMGNTTTSSSSFNNTGRLSSTSQSFSWFNGKIVSKASISKMWERNPPPRARSSLDQHFHPDDNITEQNNPRKSRERNQQEEEEEEKRGRYQQQQQQHNVSFDDEIATEKKSESTSAERIPRPVDEHDKRRRQKNVLLR